MSNEADLSLTIMLFLALSTCGIYLGALGGGSAAALPHTGSCGLWTGNTINQFCLEAIISGPPGQSRLRHNVGAPAENSANHQHGRLRWAREGK